VTIAAEPGARAGTGTGPKRKWSQPLYSGKRKSDLSFMVLERGSSKGRGGARPGKLVGAKREQEKGEWQVEEFINSLHNPEVAGVGELAVPPSRGKRACKGKEIQQG